MANSFRVVVKEDEYGGNTLQPSDVTVYINEVEVTNVQDFQFSMGVSDIITTVDLTLVVDEIEIIREQDFNERYQKFIDIDTGDTILKDLKKPAEKKSFIEQIEDDGTDS